MMNVQDFFTQTLPQIISIASLISAALPEPNPGSIGYILKQVINFFALNVFNAKNAPSNKSPANIIKEFILAIGAATLAYHALQTRADTPITITQPNTRTNGSAFDPTKDSSGTKLYRKDSTGTVVIALPANSTTYSLPATCDATVWWATVLDKTPPPVGPLESAASNTLNTTIDATACAPAKPSIAITGG